MAAALISITGTSGNVLLRYKIGTIQHNVEADIGNIYIEDTATNVTYTTLSGNAIASSLVFSITALPFVYYDLFWKGIIADDYSFVSFTTDNIITPIVPTVPFPNSDVTFANVINALNVEFFKIIKYKKLVTSLNILTGKITYSISYIIRSTNSAIEFKIKNADNTGFIYLKPTSVLLTSLTGYTDIDTCVAQPTVPLS